MSESPYERGTTHFGFRDVAAKDKQKLVGEVFTSVAGKYDLMNDLMSLGIHRVWKRYFVGTCQVKRGDRVLDLAGGTGDIAALLKDRVGDTGQIVLGDINAGMLSVGRDRMTDRGVVQGLEYVQCNAEALPFPDASFDLVTIAFGLRNVTDKAAALRDMHRVLKVGGQARVLEFSEVTVDWFKPVYDFHQQAPAAGRAARHDGRGRLCADQLQEPVRRHRRHPYRLQGLRAAGPRRGKLGPSPVALEVP
jgi:demethylmenaquinone methyltransferase/2-methoxy-6-polyprenyl-1,4-benzoquinol methylase